MKERMRERKKDRKKERKKEKKKDRKKETLVSTSPKECRYTIIRKSSLNLFFSIT